MLALKAGGRGDITSSHVLWSFDNGPDVPTPVTDGKYLYIVNDRGIVFSLDAKSGETIWGPQRIAPGTYSSSPVLADGKVYVTNEDGVTTVMKSGPEFGVIAENDLDGYTLSSIAISRGQLFIRTDELFVLRWGAPAVTLFQAVVSHLWRTTAEGATKAEVRSYEGPSPIDSAAQDPGTDRDRELADNHRDSRAARSEASVTKGIEASATNVPIPSGTAVRVSCPTAIRPKR